MYVFKKNSPQQKNVITKAKWNPTLGSVGASVGTVAPQIETVTAYEDFAEVSFATVRSIEKDTAYSVGVALALKHEEPIHHYEMVGQGFIYNSTGTAGGRFCYPFWSYHSDPLVADPNTQTNLTDKYRAIAGSGGQGISTVAATTMLVADDPAIYDAGHAVIFGFTYFHEGNGPSSCYIAANFSIAKNNGAIQTFDPER